MGTLVIVPLLSCRVHKPEKVYTFSFIVGVKCIHSATKVNRHLQGICFEASIRALSTKGLSALARKKVNRFNYGRIL